MNPSANRPLDLLAAMRPGQWTKNAVVAAAFFFTIGDREQPLALGPAAARAAAATVLFCLVSSAVYLLNDVRDREADRRHPDKRNRPIADGRVTPPAAGLLAAALLALGLAGAWALSPAFAAAAAGYAGLQTAYSLFLKRVALLDVLVIAAGFALRALAGALVLAVRISPWLLLCAFLLALFLAICKRRHEKVQVAGAPADQRRSLDGYEEGLLDQLAGIVSAATIVSYSIYTLWPDTVAKFGTAGLGLTIPFVMFGIFRYLDLVYRHQLGDRPDRIVLTDMPLLLDLGAYGVTVLLVFAWAH